MSPVEVAHRARDQALRTAWSRRQVRPGAVGSERGSTRSARADRMFTTVLPAGTANRVPRDAVAAILASANQLLRGEWDVLGTVRTDMVRPD